MNTIKDRHLRICDEYDYDTIEELSNCLSSGLVDTLEIDYMTNTNDVAKILTGLKDRCTVSRLKICRQITVTVLDLVLNYVKNHQLEVLDVVLDDDNNDVYNMMIDILKISTAYALTIHWNCIIDCDNKFSKIVSCVKNNELLICLTIYNLAVPVEFIECLSSKKMTNIDFINCSYWNCNQEIVNLLKTSKSIRGFYMNNFRGSILKYDTKIIQNIIKVVQENDALISFRINAPVYLLYSLNNSNRTLCSANIANYISTTRNLRSLNLDGCSFENSTNVLKCLFVNDTIEILSIEQCNIAVNELISNLLKVNKTLTKLNLSDNNLTYQANFIADSIVENTTLLDLNLRQTNISYEGIINLLNSLKINNTLEILNIANNSNISDTTMDNIISCLASNTNLQNLHIDYHPNIAGLISSNNTLKIISVSIDHYMKGEYPGVAESLENNYSITELFLDRNNENIETIEALLARNKTNLQQSMFAKMKPAVH